MTTPTSEPKLLPSDRAMLARIEAMPAAGDLVEWGERERGVVLRRYAVANVYTEATDGKTHMLLRVNESVTPGVLRWFEPLGRVDPRELRIVERGAFAERVDFWRRRYAW